MKTLSVILFMVIFSGIGASETLIVPTDYDKIQSAINLQKKGM